MTPKQVREDVATVRAVIAWLASGQAHEEIESLADFHSLASLDRLALKGVRRGKR